MYLPKIICWPLVGIRPCTHLFLQQKSQDQGTDQKIFNHNFIFRKILSKLY